MCVSMVMTPTYCNQNLVARSAVTGDIISGAQTKSFGDVTFKLVCVCGRGLSSTSVCVFVCSESRWLVAGSL